MYCLLQGKRMSVFLENLLSFIYPPFCLHCEEGLEKPQDLLCRSCLEHVQLLDVRGRCRYCFTLCEERTVCRNCSLQKAPFRRGAATVEGMGPAYTLFQNFASGKRPHLAASLGALMTMQYLELQWPFPDLIVPIPSTWGMRWQLGYDPVALLAKEVGKALQKPVVRDLKRNGWIPEIYSHFRWKKRTDVSDKRILMVADAFSKDNALPRSAAATVYEAFPLEICVLAFAKH